MTSAARGMSTAFLLSFDSDWLHDTAKRLNVCSSDVLEALVRQARKEEKETGKPFTPTELCRTRTEPVLPGTPERVRKLRQAGHYSTLEEQRKNAIYPYTEFIGLAQRKKQNSKEAIG